MAEGTQPFELTTPSGLKVTGWSNLGSIAHVGPTAPLVVAIHGGAMSSYYWDPDAQHSLVPTAHQLSIPVIAVDRPGYRGSTGVPYKDTESGSTIIEQGRALADHIIPAIYSTYASQLGIRSIVLFGHSIGGAITIAAASLHDAKKFPLAGIVVTGVGSLTPQDSDWDTLIPPEVVTLNLPLHVMKGMSSAIPGGAFHPNVEEQIKRTSHEVPRAELVDITQTFRTSCPKLAATVRCPVTYAIGEYDL